jgi:hypothetical protein
LPYTDWKFVRHISDVDKLNEQTLARLLADSRWRVDYQTAIEAYTQCEVVECAPRLTAHVRAHVTRECQVRVCGEACMYGPPIYRLAPATTTCR